MAFWNKPISKWQPKDWFLPATGYSAYKNTTTPPKIPEYQPSAWEQEGYDWLKGLREGTSSLLNTENTYQYLKDKLTPEYQRLQKEYDIYSAQRGIQGGPQQAFKQGMAEDQVQRLMNARRQLEEQKRQLQMAAGQTMTQLGSSRSAAESQRAMMQFQTAYQEYQKMQQALADLLGSGIGFLSSGLNQSFTQNQTQPQNQNPFGDWRNSLIGTTTGEFPLIL